MQQLWNNYTSFLVRTWFGDQEAWERVRQECLASVGPEGFTADFNVAEDPANDGATVADVLAAMPVLRSTYVLIADEDTFTHQPATVLVVSTVAEEQGASFRATPASVAQIEAQLPIANMSFWEFQRIADAEPERVFRGFAVNYVEQPVVAVPEPVPGWAMLTYVVSCCDNPEALTIRVPIIDGALGQMATEAPVRQGNPPVAGGGEVETSDRPPTIRSEVLRVDGAVALDCPTCGRHEQLTAVDLARLARVDAADVVPPAQRILRMSVDRLLDRIRSLPA